MRRMDQEVVATLAGVHSRKAEQPRLLHSRGVEQQQLRSDIYIRPMLMPRASHDYINIIGTVCLPCRVALGWR